ncbi:MAG: thioredoxin domain-containing protein [Candidatus Magasanikbacteria bacterium]|nr:thioredoxin domain-containing protein [Candidatus Magasanikbacteria bacterium]
MLLNMEDGTQMNNKIPWNKTTGGKIFLVIITIIFIFLAVFSLLVVYYTLQIKYGDSEELAKQFYSEKFSLAVSLSETSSIEIDKNLDEIIRDNNPVRGSSEAPVTVVAFIDFTCPYCQEAYKPLEDIYNQYRGGIKIVFKHFPLTTIHPEAGQAAIVSACAQEQNAFWQAYHLFFTDENFLEKNNSLKAEMLEINAEQFEKCVNSARHINKIEQDLTDGVSFGVKGTPTYFINQTKIEGLVEKEVWQAVIEEEIKKSL